MTDPAGPGVVETHVSLLVFHEDVVLKLKKPVHLPFLDFRDVEARRRACEAEVEANRRLSPDVYLGVADVALEGTALDHAVVMRRLPAGRSLAALVAPPRSPPGSIPLEVHLRALADLLARFHARAARSAAIDAAARAPALGRIWEACLASLVPHAGRLVDAEVVNRIGHLAARYLAGRGPLLERRISEGRICDGHGDLLAGDVFLLDDGPRILDCIEFDPRLRHVDVIADVAFLAMDLERLGAGDVASRWLSLYQRAAGERFPPTLLEHYLAERATVRAEVACVRAAQTSARVAEADGLARLALEHLEAGRVVLGVVSGLPGTGKSSVAAAAGTRLGWPVLRSDEIRRELVDPGGTGPLLASSWPGAYSEEVTARVYATMLERARAALGLGQSVLLDATFAPERQRRLVEALAERSSSDLVVLRCTAPVPVVRTRLRTRQAKGRDVSGADEDVARSMARQTRPWERAVHLDTDRPLGEAVEAACALLCRAPGPRPTPVAPLRGDGSVADRRPVAAFRAMPTRAREESA